MISERFMKLARTLSAEQARHIGRVFQAKGIPAKAAEYEKLTEAEGDLFIALVEAKEADRKEYFGTD